MKRKSTIVCLLLGASISVASGKPEEFRAVALESIDCSMTVPVDWTFHTKTNDTHISWVITPDNLNIGPYRTGVRIDSLLKVESRTGTKASKWVDARILNKSTTLEILSSESSSSDDLFKVRRVVTQEVYSSGRTDYTTYRMIYSWFWNDTYDVVICMVTRTPEKSWESMAAILGKIGKLEFDETAWKKKSKQLRAQ